MLLTGVSPQSSIQGETHRTHLDRRSMESHHNTCLRRDDGMPSFSHRGVRVRGMPHHAHWTLHALMYACSTAVMATPGMATLGAPRKTSAMFAEKQAGRTVNGPDMIRGLVAAVYSPIAPNQSLHLDPVSIDAQVCQHTNANLLCELVLSNKQNKLRGCSLYLFSYLQQQTVTTLYRTSAFLGRTPSDTC